ncbi:MAG: hypothetical protein A2X18_11440 [Bacteroidetes bacterium GWF2_40_14]|nr:MAG: hypothetical protein A2X18_11440 [Bacteroidetes bacterium GWF2_40_14]
MASFSYAQPKKKTDKQPVGSQKVYYKSEDRSIFDKYSAYIYNKTNLPDNQLIIETAKFFLNVPYVANTLEIEPEGLVVNLRSLDCTTFVETVFALAMTAKTKVLTFDNFCSKLRLVRYRNGVINDYTDRLHYTSDWIYQNQEKKIVKNISKMPGSKPLILNLHIMSSNTNEYKQLNGKEDLIGKIKAKESEINSREHYYLPAEEIDRRASQFKSGDMVGFVTTIPGIDISHVGIIYKDGKKLTFIHASSTHKKVVINKDPLSVFVKGTGRNTGIVLARARF